QKKPQAPVTIAPGISIAYRRNKGAGTWVALVADGKGGRWTKGFAIADDHENADGEHILDFWQAQEKAKTLARGSVETGKPISVSEALDEYASDLKGRGGLSGNVVRVRAHLPPSLATKPVATLTARELKRWRDGLDMKPASVNRTTRILKAALNLAHRLDPARVVSTHAWKIGL